jgi:hypothetical protein
MLKKLIRLNSSVMDDQTGRQKLQISTTERAALNMVQLVAMMSSNGETIDVRTHNAVD